MRLLVVSDLHYRLKQLDWVLSVAGEYDLVVVAGDHLDISSAVEPDAQIAVTLEYLARIATKTTVIACSGNHDLEGYNEFGERAARWLESAQGAQLIVDGARLDTDIALVTVCPWWDGPRTRDVVGRQLADDATRVGDRRWIWVHHAPPDATKTSWTGKRYYGDAELTQWIGRYEPDLVVSGHVHESPFKAAGSWIDHVGRTVVVNAGRQIGPVPTCIEVDLSAAHARWSSLAGVEKRSLTEA
jgi:Icc-related predicted phosphoesterase